MLDEPVLGLLAVLIVAAVVVLLIARARGAKSSIQGVIVKTRMRFGREPEAQLDASLLEDLGVTEAERFELWRKRYTLSDGTIRRGMHFGRIVGAIDVLRSASPDRLAIYTDDRRRR